MAPTAASREELVAQIFRRLDADEDGRLKMDEMRKFAILLGLKGDASKWEAEYSDLCQDYGIRRDAGFTQAALIELLDDKSEKGFYCTDKELVAIHRKAPAQRAEPVLNKDSHEMHSFADHELEGFLPLSPGGHDMYSFVTTGCRCDDCGRTVHDGEIAWVSRKNRNHLCSACSPVRDLQAAGSGAAAAKGMQKRNRELAERQGIFAARIQAMRHDLQEFDSRWLSPTFTGREDLSLKEMRSAQEEWKGLQMKEAINELASYTSSQMVADEEGRSTLLADLVKIEKESAMHNFGWGIFDKFACDLEELLKQPSLHPPPSRERMAKLAGFCDKWAGELSKLEDERLDKVSIEKTEHIDHLGVQWIAHEERLKITAVEQGLGLISEWNARHSDHPVQAGDYIVVVNDVRGNPVDMESVISTSRKLELCICQTDPVVIRMLRKKVQKLKKAQEILEGINTACFLTEHWKEMFRILGLVGGVRPETLTFRIIEEKLDVVLSMGVELKNLAARAAGEAPIRKFVAEVQAWFDSAKFSFFHYKATGAETVLFDVSYGSYAVELERLCSEHNVKSCVGCKVKGRTGREFKLQFKKAKITKLEPDAEEADFPLTVSEGSHVPLIKDMKDMISAASDNSIKCSSLSDSRYLGLMREKVCDFIDKLKLLDELLPIMNEVQCKWVDLERIFSRVLLPGGTERFQKLDREYRQIMGKLESRKKVKYLCKALDLKKRFTTLAKQLDLCQKALSNFLEKKRDAFPRFYFIGDEELRDILGQPSNPHVIQAHLKKLFAGIAKVDFDETVTRITAMNSALGEKVHLSSTVAIKHEDGEPRKIEEWLSELLKKMVVTLSRDAKACYDQRAHDERDISCYEQHPSQLLCLSANISFTETIEKCIDGDRRWQQMKELLERLSEQLRNMTSTEPEGDLLQSKVKALIFDLIHNKDVLEQLIAKNVVHTGDWYWFKQLRYYLRPDETISVWMLDCQQNYSFEYQGNAAKLVHTPLTDKCYLTLMHGMKLGYGGNPYGPAGTGKTESVKALGACMGRQVIVTNCSESVDSEAMDRFFVGLVRCGAWGCFDEFNRLQEEVMSAISRSVQLIQGAIKHGHDRVHLPGLDGDIVVNCNAGIFITLNPASKRYGGRQKLPGNLKQLFRPVAMSIPDDEIIAEVMLLSEGFQTAKKLAKKVVSLFLLSRQLLSTQNHYEWGLRALKPILAWAGLHRRQRVQDGAAQPNEKAKEEEAILLKSVCMQTLSKLTFVDASRFESLCKDVFPNMSVEVIKQADLEVKIREVLQELNLSENPLQISQMLQFHEACQQNIGVGIVGPSGCGKSTIWRVLEKAYKKQGKTYALHKLNPKARPRERLLGYMNPDTREWFDGVLTASARKACKVTEEDATITHSWIICDGDVDPVWVESLNSVLDDNRLFTMPNGDRLQFGKNVNFIFETDSLQFASPATISRLAIVFFSEEIDMKYLISAWIKTQAERQMIHQDELQKLFADIFYPAMDWAYRSGAHGGQRPLSIETSRVGMLRNVFGHLEQKESAYFGGSEEAHQSFITKEEFLLAVCRGLGGNLSDEDRQQLTRVVFEKAQVELPDPTTPFNVQCIKGSLYPYNPQELLQESSERSFEKLEKCGKLPPLIPTVWACMHRDLFLTWLKTGKSFIVSGPMGCGKNLLIQHAIRDMQKKDEAIMQIVIHCNARTSSQDIRKKLLQLDCNRNTAAGRVCGPNNGRRVILYLKDINIPEVDKFDTSEVSMLLHQFVMHEGFYDDDLEFVRLQNVQIVGTITPANTFGRHKLCIRLSSILLTCSIADPGKKELEDTYAQLVATVLNSPGYKFIDEKAESMSRKVAEKMVSIYGTVKESYTVDDRGHYLFNPRDLTQWILQLLRYEVSSLEQFLQAWAHEACRIFGDRLVGQKARDSLVSEVGRAMQQLRSSKVNVKELCYSACLYGTSMVQVSREEYKKKIEAEQHALEEKRVGTPIVLIPEVIDQLACVDRVFGIAHASARSDLLMVGRAGGGRRSVVLLMSQMHKFEVFSPSLRPTYGEKEWAKDFQDAMKMAGVEKKNTVLLLEDHHLLQPEFLKHINSLLSAGDMLDIWAQEEVDSVLQEMAEEFEKVQFAEGTAAQQRAAKLEYFVNQARQRCRIVLCMDPTHPHFLPFCAANPALFSCTTVVWLDEWSLQSQDELALRLVGDKMADGMQMEVLLDIHKSQYRAGASPRHFISLLQTSREIFEERESYSEAEIEDLDKRLTTLVSVARKIKELETLSEKNKEEVEESNKKARLEKEKCQKARDEVQTDAEQKKQKAKTTAQEKESLKQMEGKLQKETEELNNMLAKAKDDLQLDRIELRQVSEWVDPPVEVKDVLNAVRQLMNDFSDTSWKKSQEFLKNARDKIMKFNPSEQVSPQQLEVVQKLMKDKPKLFDDALEPWPFAESLATWVKACVDSHVKGEQLQEKQNQLRNAQKELTGKERELKTKEEELEAKTAELQRVEEELKTKEQDNATLQENATRTDKTIQSLKKLHEEMSDKSDNWTNKKTEIENNKGLLAPNACLSAAYVVYLGRFSEDIRKDSNHQWVQIARKAGFKLKQFDYLDYLAQMSSERNDEAHGQAVEKNEAQQEEEVSRSLTCRQGGLGSDPLSQENAAIITCSKKMRRVPFVVDPSSQALAWLKHLYGQNAQAWPQQDPKILSKLQNAVELGKTFIIEEVDGIQSYLFPLLRMDLQRDQTKQSMLLGGKPCDYDRKFHLLLCTRNPNAINMLPPNASCLVTCVNFTVTMAGLTDQLLGVILQYQEPTLERPNLQTQEFLQNEKDVKKNEKALLDQLKDVGGKSIDECSYEVFDVIIQDFEKLKILEEKQYGKKRQFKESNADWKQKRKLYEPLANLGSLIFKSTLELSQINPMYHFSRESFIDLFETVLKKTMSGDHESLGNEEGLLKDATTKEILESLGEKLKVKVLVHISRALLKDDRLTFGLHMIHYIMPEKFKPNEWEHFQGIFISASEPSLPNPDWCPPEEWATQNLQRLRAAFPDFDKVWRLHESELWDDWVNAVNCEQRFDPSLDDESESDRSDFQRVLLIQAVRPDRLDSALIGFTCKALGVTDTDRHPPLHLPSFYEDDTTKQIPVLFVTTPGADPSLELENFAKQKEIKFHPLPMGGGQNQHDALQQLRKAAKVGDWVCLKNLHLVVGWVPVLEKEIKKLLQPNESDHVHENFRCWLTTEAHPEFSPILLEKSLKVSYEAPPGVKMKFLKTLESWDEEKFGSGSKVRSQMMLVCAYFHAIMQERRTYIPQGWTHFYEFSDSDLQSALETVSALVETAEDREPGQPDSGLQLDWATLKGVLDCAVYGSRVDNKFDSGVVSEYTSLLFRKEILEDGHEIPAFQIPAFQIPCSTDKSVCCDFVKNLDKGLLDDPESFGMAPNAGRAQEHNNSRKAIKMLKQLKPVSLGTEEDGEGSKGSSNVEAWAQKLCPLWEQWHAAKQNSLSKYESIEAREVQSEDPPVVAFVLKEATEASQLETYVTQSLETLQKVVKKTLLSTPAIQTEAQCLMRGSVPQSWTVSWPFAPEDPASFLEDLADHIVALKRDWLKRVENRNMMLFPVKLSNFLRPDVFLNALRQQTARRLEDSIDNLQLVASFQSASLSGPRVPMPVRLQGLILEGCNFDYKQHILVDCETPFSKRTSELPELTIAWISKDAYGNEAQSKLAVQGTGRRERSLEEVPIPIYASPLDRERVIGEVCLHTAGGTAGRRVLNSVALFLRDGA